MIAIIYQWRLAQGKEHQFVEAWSAITALLKLQGSLGAALFDGPEQTVFAIARWPDLETRSASSARRADPELYAKMIDAIEEELQEQVVNERLNFWS